MNGNELKDMRVTWWSRLLALLLVALMVFMGIAMGKDVWDGADPWPLTMAFLGIFALYFVVRRLEDLTTVWRTRWPGKHFHR